MVWIEIVGNLQICIAWALDELEFVKMFNQIKSGSLQEARCYVLKGRGYED